MSKKNGLERVKEFILRGMWNLELSNLPRVHKVFFHWLRTLSLAAHGFIADKCPLRAAALTLVFVFSLAPALAVALSVAKGFGAQELVQTWIFDQLRLRVGNGMETPAVQELQKMASQIMEYVNTTNIRRLGLIGVLIMLYAAYRVLLSIEKTMNDIWGIRRARAPIRRTVDYMAILFVLPMTLMITALLTTIMGSQHTPAFIQNIRELMPAFMVQLIGTAASLTLALLAFSFLYSFFPNTRVRIRSAVSGALVAALLWQILQVIFIQLQLGVNRSNAVYGTFAAVPIFLVWLHSSWLVVLFGAEVSYAHANQRDLEYGGLSFHPGAAYVEELALGAMLVVSRAFQNQEEAPTCEYVAQRLAAPVRVLRPIFSNLVANHLLSEIQDDVLRFQPAAPPNQISVGKVLSVVREEETAITQTGKILERIGLSTLLQLRSQPEEKLRNMSLFEVLHLHDK